MSLQCVTRCSKLLSVFVRGSVCDGDVPGLKVDVCAGDVPCLKVVDKPPMRNSLKLVW